MNHQLNIRLDTATHSNLSQLAEERGASIADLARSAVKKLVQPPQIVTIINKDGRAVELEAKIVETQIDGLNFWFGVYHFPSNDISKLKEELKMGRSFEVIVEDGRRGFAEGNAARLDMNGYWGSIIGKTPLARPND